MTRIIHSESGGPTSGVSASVAQALQTIAANLPAIQQDLSRQSGYLDSWTVEVSGAAAASQPQSVLSRSLKLGQTAGGLLVSNPTSNTLIILLYTNTVPAQPTQANAAQSLVLRPYSWQTLPTVSWRGIAVETFGVVVSTVKTALVAAYTQIAPGSGLMQEDITSSSAKWWVQTSLVSGDSISLSSPWGGSIDVDMVSLTTGVPMLALKVGAGFSGKISGSVGGGYISLGSNFAGSLQLNSPGNIVLEAGRANKWHMTMNPAGYDAHIRLGDAVAGSMVWQSQTSTLLVDDGAVLSAVGYTSILGNNVTGAGANGSDFVHIGRGAAPLIHVSGTGKAGHYNCIVDCEAGSFPGIYVNTVSATGMVYQAQIRVGMNSQPVIKVEAVGGTIRAGSVITGSNVGVSSAVTITANSGTIQACQVEVGDEVETFTLAVTTDSGTIENVSYRIGDRSTMGGRIICNNGTINGVNVVTGPSTTSASGLLLRATTATLQHVNAVWDIASSGSMTLSISSGTMQGVNLMMGKGSHAAINVSGTKVTAENLVAEILDAANATLSVSGGTGVNNVRFRLGGIVAVTLPILSTTLGEVSVSTEPGSYAQLTVGAKNTQIAVGAGSALSATVSSGPTRIVVPPSTTNWLGGAPTKTVSGTWVPGNRTIWYHPSSTKTATFTSPVLAIGDVPNLLFHSRITAAKGSLTWQLLSQGKDGTLYPQYTATSVTTATSLVVSFGPGLQHNLALGQQVRWQAIIQSTTTATSPSFTLSYSFEGTGGSV